MADMRHCPSPNFGPRKNGLTPHLIVIHYTAMHSAKAAIERLCDPAAEVSAHYFIALNGQVTQMVAEDQRAWHAGAGEWAGQDDINSRSIGIELDNLGTHPFPDTQMCALETLIGQIMARWQIAPSAVIAHSDMAPGRKSDPGPHFDWARLARQGLAAASRGAMPSAATPETFRQAARAAGYTSDAPFETLLHTTRLRHAPWRTGPLQGADHLLGC